MACSVVDHLKKVALEGFPLTDKLYGWQAGKAEYYHHHQKQKQQMPAPNQYVYHGPQTLTVVQQPGSTGSYHQIPTTKNYERSWHVCQASQAPMAAAISSNTTDAAAYC